MNGTIPGGPLNDIQSFESVPAMLARSAESHPGMESKSKGEEIWVIVVPEAERLIEKAGRSGDSLSTGYARDLIAREIRRFNAGQPIYKHITGFILRNDELPGTTTRRIKRREILKEAGPEPQEVFRI